MKMNTCGHPDRRHEARGMCKSCYDSWYKANRQPKGRSIRDFSDRVLIAEMYRRIERRRIKALDVLDWLGRAVQLDTCAESSKNDNGKPAQPNSHPDGCAWPANAGARRRATFAAPPASENRDEITETPQG